MRAASAAAVVLATASAAEAQTAGDSGGCARHAAEFAFLVGLTEAEAVAAMERMPGNGTVRVAGPGRPMTRDFRPDRATPLLREGRVEQVICG